MPIQGVYPGFQRGGCLRSGPVRKVGGGGGGGSPRQVRYTKSGGEGGNSLQVRYQKRGGGGGPVRFKSDTFVWHTENTLSLIINGYNFDQGGG